MMIAHDLNLRLRSTDLAGANCVLKYLYDNALETEA